MDLFFLDPHRALGRYLEEGLSTKKAWKDGWDFEVQHGSQKVVTPLFPCK